MSLLLLILVAASCWCFLVGRGSSDASSSRSAFGIRSALLSLLSISLIASLSTNAIADVPSWEVVTGQLRDRQERFRCVTVEFDEVLSQFKSNGEIKSKPITLKSKWKVQLKGSEQVRVEQKGDIEPQTNTAGEPVTFAERVTVTNGTVHASFMPNFGGEYPAGFIDVKDETHLPESVSLTTIALCFRPLQWLQQSDTPAPANGVELRHAMLGGVECLVATWSHRSFTTRLWLDQRLDYAPQQLSVVHRPSQRELRWRVRYGDNSDPDIPTGWTYASLAANRNTLNGLTATVTSFTTADVPDNAFSIEFPAGTFVMDAVLQRNYVILQGGQRREVKDEEWQPGKSYEDVLAGPQDVVSHSQPGRTFGIILTVGVITVLIALKVVQIRNRQTE